MGMQLVIATLKMREAMTRRGRMMKTLKPVQSSPEVDCGMSVPVNVANQSAMRRFSIRVIQVFTQASAQSPCIS